MSRVRWRRRLLASLVILLCITGGAQLYLTQPARIQAQLQALLAELDVGLVRVGYSSFSIFGGLRLVDLQVFEAADHADAEPLVRVADARIQFDRLALLTGTFKPTDAVLRGVQAHIEFDRGSGRWNLRIRSQPGDDEFTHHTEGWPNIRVSDLDLRFDARNGERLELHRRWIASVEGQRVSGDTPGERHYRLRLTQTSGPTMAPRRQASRPLLECEFGPSANTLSSGWVDLESVAAIAGPQIAGMLHDARVRGAAALERCRLDPTGALIDCQVWLEQISALPPIEPAESGVAPEQRFVQLQALGGALKLAASEQGRRRVEWTLQGRVSGGDFHTSGRIDADADALERLDLSQAIFRVDARATDLTFPDPQQHAAFINSPALPEPIRAFFHDYIPRGRFDATVSVRCPQRGAAPLVEAEIAPRGGICRYKRFQYDIEDVHGLVRVTPERIYLDGLHGRHGASRIRADGWCIDSSSWTGFELHFSGEPLLLDADLYHAIPASYQKLWREARPSGLSTVQVHMTRAHGDELRGALDPTIEVTARLVAADVTVANNRLRQCDGVVRISDQGVWLHDLHGYLGPGSIRLDGHVDIPEQGAAPYDLHVEAAQIAIQRNNELVDARGTPLGSIRFDGLGDVWAQVRPCEPRCDSHYAIHARQGALTGFDPQTPWPSASAWVVVSEEGSRILSAEARCAASHLQLAGDLPSGGPAAQTVALDLDASTVDVGNLLKRIVPERWSQVREALGLSGAGRVTARFEPEPTNPPRQAAAITLRAALMKPLPLPLSMQDVEAELRVSSAGFTLQRATAAYGEARIRCSGAGGWDPPWVELQGEASGLRFSDALLNALPRPLGGMLARTAPRGGLDVRLRQVRYEPSAADPWKFSGTIAFGAADLKLGVPFSEFDALLDGECRLDRSGAATLLAEVQVPRGKLAGRAVSELSATVLRNPQERRTRIEELHAQLCDGELVGALSIDAESGEYDLSATLSDISLPLFLRRESSGAMGRGRLDGKVFLRGRGDSIESVSGGGDVRVRGVELLSDPLTRALAGAARSANQRISDQLDQAELRFNWQGTALYFNQIDLYVGDLRLVGEGRWDMRSDQLDLTLVGAAPRAGRVAGLTELLEAAQSELIQYRVEGSASAPRVTSRPLHTITEPIRRLFRR